MYSNHYDAIVVGGRLATLAMAASLATRGFRTLVVPHRDRLQSYDCEGRRLLRRLDPPDLHSPTLDLMLRQLGIAKPKSAPNSLILSPPHALQTRDTSVEHELWSDDIAREFADVANSIEKVREYVQTRRALAVEHAQIAKSRGLLRFFAASKLPAKPPAPAEVLSLEAMFPAQHAFVQMLEAATRHATAQAAELEAKTSRSAELSSSWMFCAAVGWGHALQLEHAFVSKIREHGGELLHDEQIQHVHLHRGRIDGVTLKQSGDKLGASHLVFAGAPNEMLALLQDASVLDSHLARFGEPRVRWYRYVLNLVVRGDAIPDALAAHMLLLGNATSKASPSLRCMFEPSSGADEHERRVVIESLMPRRVLDETGGGQSAGRTAILARLGATLPFFERSVILHHSDHDGLGAVGEAADARNALAVATSPMDAVYAYRDSDSDIAMPIESPIERCWFGGQHHLPSLGFEGELLTASKIVERIAATDKRPKLSRPRLT